MKLIMAVLTLAICVYPAQAGTLSEMRDKVRSVINDTGPPDSYRYSDSIINGWINEAQRYAIARTQGIIVEYNITTTTTTAIYSLPADFITTDRVYIINTSTSRRTSYNRIGQININKLDNDSLSWGDAALSRPTNYLINKTSAAVKIELYPPPSSSYAGTDYLKVFYIPVLTDMSADGDEPFNGLTYLQPYRHIITDYTIYRLTKNVEWLKVFEAGLEYLRQDINRQRDQFEGGQLRPYR